MHKNTKVTPKCRVEIYELWKTGKRVATLAKMFRVSRPTIYKILKRARMNDFSIHLSINHRYKQALYGLRKLSKTEKKLEAKLRKRARRYEKDYPGEMVHFDSKRMPRIKGENKKLKREVLFVGIDDNSRYLFADVLPNGSMDSSSLFLEMMIDLVPFKIECAYSDNGTEFKGSSDHDFRWVCDDNGIEQKFTRVARPQTNGKAERVIRTLIEEWMYSQYFSSREERRKILQEFVYYYNTTRPHSALKKGKEKMSPLQHIQNFLNQNM